jgi:Domain of unknown function (DUF1906)
LLISYQYRNGNIATFTRERGGLDANKCLEKVAELGQPKGSAIYFGVDEGWDGEAEVKKVIRYFSAINNVVAKNGNKFEVGVYGSGLMCSRMQKEGLAKFFWIAGLSDAWPGKVSFPKNGPWNLLSECA